MRRYFFSFTRAKGILDGGKTVHTRLETRRVEPCAQPPHGSHFTPMRPIGRVPPQRSARLFVAVEFGDHISPRYRNGGATLLRRLDPVSARYPSSFGTTCYVLYTLTRQGKQNRFDELDIHAKFIIGDVRAEPQARRLLDGAAPRIAEQQNTTLDDLVLELIQGRGRRCYVYYVTQKVDRSRIAQDRLRRNGAHPARRHSRITESVAAEAVITQVSRRGAACRGW
jgi:hypothetical protein